MSDLVRHNVSQPVKPSEAEPRGPLGNRSTRRLFAAYVVITVIFSIIVPWHVCTKYHVAWKPLDWYPMSTRGGDYAATYVAANALLNGLSIWDNHADLGPRLTDPAASGPRARYGYPPLQVFMLWPLGLLDFADSLRVWNGISLGLIAISILLAARMYSGWVLVAAAGVMIYAPSSFVQFHLERGQTDSLVLLLMVLFAYFYFHRRNIWLAGFFLAAVTLLKLVPGLLGLLLLLRRDWRGVLVTAGAAALIVVATGVQNWWYWTTQIIPYCQVTIYGCNIDHALAYLLQGFIGDTAAALRYARPIVAALLLVFVSLHLAHPRRRDLWPIDLAILSILFEFAPPFSVNYKLVALLFVFLVPFALPRLAIVRPRPVLAALPVLAAIVAMAPVFGEYVTRLPFSLLAQTVSGDVLVSNPLDPFITERKVVVALALTLLYLMTLYAVDAVAVRRSARAQTVIVTPRCAGRAWWAVGIVAASAVLVFFCGVAARGWLQRRGAAYAAEYTRLPAPKDIGPGLRLEGYAVRADAPQEFTMDVVFAVQKPPPGNYHVFVHLLRKNEAGQDVGGGKNFFPSLITSYWPAGRKVVARTTVGALPGEYDVRAGLFELGTGQRFAYGEIGMVSFASP